MRGARPARGPGSGPPAAAAGTGKRASRLAPMVAATTPPAVAPARRAAFAVVRRVFEQDAFADRALRGECDRLALDARDRALAMRLAYGAVQRRATLDHVAGALAGRPVARLDPPVRAALRLGLLQLLFLDAIPAHAAVDESVELAKGAGSRGAGLVNAVLRRAVAEGPALLAALDDATPEGAALRHSHPRWIAELWWEALGPEMARALLAHDNEPPESAVRANTLVLLAAALATALADLGVATRPAPELPEGLVLDGPFDAYASALWEAGALMPQSRASMLVARVLDPRAGERVLDLCAAPGAKTTQLAALMGATGEIVAVERHAGRAAALGRTCLRMRAGNVRVEVADAAASRTEDERFDRVLVDPPCSALGTLQSRPDARWRGGPERVAELAAAQARILAAGAAALRPGGVLVYSTCTISPEENERLIDRFLADHADFAADDLQADHALWQHPSVARHLQTLPQRDGTDGFFIARLRRAGEPG